MSLSSLLKRPQNYYRRNIGKVLFRKPVTIAPERPLISFTFDDFPRSALHAGGAILASHGLAGTYYVALSLLGTDGPSGPLFTAEDLTALLQQGHELGCHTYGHCNSYDTSPEDFEKSVLQNRAALGKLIPGASFKSFSYPLSEPRATSKMKISRYFLTCRAGGQTFNSGTADSARLSAYFLEKSRDSMQAIRDVIDQNRSANGWLIFATHDIATNPGPYGVTPEFFEKVVRYASESGARILPVAEACMALRKQRAAEKVAS